MVAPKKAPSKWGIQILTNTRTTVWDWKQKMSAEELKYFLSIWNEAKRESYDGFTCWNSIERKTCWNINKRFYILN